jgi:hypothetical protein
LQIGSGSTRRVGFSGRPAGRHEVAVETRLDGADGELDRPRHWCSSEGVGIGAAPGYADPLAELAAADPKAVYGGVEFVGGHCAVLSRVWWRVALLGNAIACSALF